MSRWRISFLLVSSSSNLFIHSFIHSSSRLVLSYLFVFNPYSTYDRYLGLSTNETTRSTTAAVATPLKKKETPVVAKLSPVMKPPPPPLPSPAHTSASSANHPVITITEHCPSTPGAKEKAQRPHSPLNRSQTDSNIAYPFEDLPEASGASNYVTKEGGFDLRVILEVSAPPSITILWDEFRVDSYFNKIKINKNV